MSRVKLILGYFNGGLMNFWYVYMTLKDSYKSFPSFLSFLFSCPPIPLFSSCSLFLWIFYNPKIKAWTITFVVFDGSFYILSNKQKVGSKESRRFHVDKFHRKVFAYDCFKAFLGIWLTLIFIMKSYFITFNFKLILYFESIFPMLIYITPPL